MASDVKGMEEITSGLTRTVLADNAVTTSLAVATSTEVDEVDAIANCLGHTILGEGADQRLATLPAGAEKAVEGEDPEVEMDSARAAKKVDKGKGRQTREEQAMNALGAACSNWSLWNDNEAEAQREAQRLREQIQKDHQDKIRAFEVAEAKRQTNEDLDAFTRQWQADLDAARVKQMRRRARKERDEEAASQLRLAAEAEAIALAERRANQERRMQEEALAAQAQRESDDRARFELSQVYDRIFAENNAIAIAQANAQKAQRQQQRQEAELIAQYHEVVARQAQQAELERRQQEELYLLQQRLAEQHQAYPQGEQVAESTEEMDTAQEGDAFEGTEMDTAPEMEASGGAEMDWEQVEDRTPLPAEPLIPSSQLIQPPNPLAAEPSAPIQEPQSPVTSFLGDDPESQALQPEASSSQAAEEPPIEANATLATAATEARAEARAAAEAEAEADAAAAAEAEAEAEAVAEATAAAEAAEAAEPDPDPAAAAPAIVEQLPPRAATPPLPPAPALAPAPSIPETIKIVFKRAVPNPTLAVLRPAISAWSPLGRLLSLQRSIPQVVLPQVLGKRAREDWDDNGRDKKKAKVEGELRLEVGGKRKREAEEFPGNKRVMLGRILGRALAVPGSRFAASPSTASPPTLVPTSTPENAPPSPPPHAGQPRPVNPHRGLAEATELYNDLPTLRAEIEWMRTQRRLNTSQKETRGKKVPTDKTVKRTVTAASYWSKYRENLSR